MLCSAASDLGLHCLPVTFLGVSRLQWVNAEMDYITLPKYLNIFISLHYNTCLFKCTENFITKNENFQMKNSDNFHISAQNMDCGYLLELPR